MAHQILILAMIASLPHLSTSQLARELPLRKAPHGPPLPPYASPTPSYTPAPYHPPTVKAYGPIAPPPPAFPAAQPEPVDDLPAPVLPKTVHSIAPPAPVYAPEHYEDGPSNYAFEYSVRDDYSGDDFSHSEVRDGYKTTGEYRVVLPDGRIQIVSYIADENGYVADVKYEGEALPYTPADHPKPYHPAPAPVHAPAPPLQHAPAPGLAPVALPAQVPEDIRVFNPAPVNLPTAPLAPVPLAPTSGPLVSALSPAPKFRAPISLAPRAPEPLDEVSEPLPVEPLLPGQSPVVKGLKRIHSPMPRGHLLVPQHAPGHAHVASLPNHHPVGSPF